MKIAERHQNKAQRGLTSILETLTAVCPHLKRKFKIVESNEETIAFEIDRFPFSVTWGETVEACIGGMQWVVIFSLSIWHTTHGGRFHPPESIDTPLFDSKDICDCIRVALETVAKEEIRQCLDGNGEEQMAAEEKKG